MTTSSAIVNNDQVKLDIVRVVESEMERIIRTPGFTAFGATGIKIRK